MSRSFHHSSLGRIITWRGPKSRAQSLQTEKKQIDYSNFKDIDMLLPLPLFPWTHSPPAAVPSVFPAISAWWVSATLGESVVCSLIRGIPTHQKRRGGVYSIRTGDDMKSLVRILAFWWMNLKVQDNLETCHVTNFYLGGQDAWGPKSKNNPLKMDQDLITKMCFCSKPRGESAPFIAPCYGSGF